jgi:hypothetical protein
MSKINYFKNFILYSDDVITDVDHLHFKIVRASSRAPYNFSLNLIFKGSLKK